MTAQPQKKQDMCHFDIHISDSDLDLPKETTGECAESNVENPEAEELSDLAAEARRKSSKRDDTGVSNEPLEDNYYAGLPPSAYEKKYRTDYPAELHLRKVCTPKPPGKRRTVDNYKTQAVATFSPVASTDKIATPKKSSTPTDSSAIPKEQEVQCQPIARNLPPIVSVSDEVVIDYLEEHNVQMLFEYFMGMCIMKTPQDPFAFTSQLADKLIRGRKNEKAFQDIPRLLNSVNVESMFRLYDRIGSGIMSQTQYKNAMESMGLVRYNQNPEGGQEDEILKETFVKEANQAIDDLIRSFIFPKKSGEC